MPLLSRSRMPLLRHSRRFAWLRRATPKVASDMAALDGANPDRVLREAARVQAAEHSAAVSRILEQARTIR